jgi:hypothetical protein
MCSPCADGGGKHIGLPLHLQKSQFIHHRLQLFGQGAIGLFKWFETDGRVVAATSVRGDTNRDIRGEFTCRQVAGALSLYICIVSLLWFASEAKQSGGLGVVNSTDNICFIIT